MSENGRGSQSALLHRMERAIGSHHHALAFYDLTSRQWRVNRGWRTLSGLCQHARQPGERHGPALGELLFRGSKQVRLCEKPLLLWSPACLKPPARAPMRWQLRFTPVLHEARLCGIVCRLHLRTGWRGLAGHATTVPWFLPAHSQQHADTHHAAQSHRQALAAGVKESVHPHDCDAFLHALEQAHRAEAPFAIDCRVRLPHGPYHWHRIAGRPTRNREGDMLGWLGGSQDRQHHTDQCRMRRAFLRLASHELNTPLTSLTLNLQLALSRAQSQKTSGEEIEAKRLAPLLARTLEQARKLGQTVETLLDVQGLVSGPLPLHRANTDITSIVTEALKAVEPMLMQAGCRVALDMEDDLRGCIDHHRMSEVFFHLFSNVAKFAPGSLLRIVGQKTQHGVQFRVHDDGPGIGQKDAKHVFELFGRGRVPRSTSGLGIGLYLCRRIVRAHGGRLFLEQIDAPGAHFVLDLPAREGDASVEARGQVAASPQEGQERDAEQVQEPSIPPEGATQCQNVLRSSSS